MRIIAALLLMLCLSWPGFAVQPKKHSPSHAAASKKKGRRGAKRKSTAQMTPTPERYKVIQQAMMAKGYAPHEPNGVWGPDWALALKRYQQDQKLEATGKLNALSLITLGVKGDPPAPAANLPTSSSSTVREPK